MFKVVLGLFSALLKMPRNSKKHDCWAKYIEVVYLYYIYGVAFWVIRCSYLASGTSVQIYKYYLLLFASRAPRSLELLFIYYLLMFGTSQRNVIAVFPNYQDVCYQVWLKSNQNCRRVSVLKFSAHMALFYKKTFKGPSNL